MLVTGYLGVAAVLYSKMIRTDKKARYILNNALTEGTEQLGDVSMKCVAPCHSELLYKSAAGRDSEPYSPTCSETN